MPLRPVVFDMDGVLVDSERLYEAAFRAYTAAVGHPAMGDRFVDTLGHRQADFLPELAADLGRPPGEVAQGLRDAEREVEAREGMQPMPYVHEALERLDRDGRPIGLASSSRRETIARILAMLDVADRFAVVAGGDEVEHGKPAPDVYLLAARRLGQEPGTCVAIEDSPTGLASAAAAGMTTIAVPHAQSAGLDLSGADHVVADLREAAALIERLDSC